MTEVLTSKGALKGKVSKGCDVFMGVPYAAPPVGELRLEPPRPHPGWEGVRNAVKPGKECIQMDIPKAIPFPQPKRKIGPEGVPSSMSEDSLYLNVYVPKDATGQLPVMVWIHGGAFVYGNSHLFLYDGCRLASTQNCIVVTVNYRLGVLGYLYTEEGGFHPNLGTLDQAEALKWVRDEIKAFGGDAGRVTIFGESAGAMSAATLLASPLADGLFHGAILQSGAGNTSISKEDAKHTAERFARSLGVPLAQLTKAYLKTLPVHRIREAEMKMKELPTHILLDLSPVVAEPDFPHPLVAIRRGAARGVPVLSGTTKDEFQLFMLLAKKKKVTPESVVRFLTKRLSTGIPNHATRFESVPAVARRIVEATAKAIGPKASAKDVLSQIATDFIFTLPHERLLAAHTGPNYSYRFDWKSPLPTLKACHAIDVPFVFGTHAHPMIKLFAGPGPQADALAKVVMDSWGAFARTGCPQTPATGDWPEFDTLSRPTMLFGSGQKGAASLVRNPRMEELAAWEGVLPSKL